MEPSQTPFRSQRSKESVASGQNWMEAVRRIASHYRIAVSPEQMRLDLAWSSEEEQLRRLARSAGLLVEQADLRRGEYLCHTLTPVG